MSRHEVSSLGNPVELPTGEPRSSREREEWYELAPTRVRATRRTNHFPEAQEGFAGHRGSRAGGHARGEGVGSCQCAATPAVSRRCRSAVALSAHDRTPTPRGMSSPRDPITDRPVEQLAEAWDFTVALTSSSSAPALASDGPQRVRTAWHTSRSGPIQAACRVPSGATLRSKAV
jgi:hypothetical protein